MFFYSIFFIAFYWNFQKQLQHRQQIKASLLKEQEISRKKKESEEEEFKSRINPEGLYHAHRDSDGLLLILRYIFTKARLFFSDVFGVPLYFCITYTV